LARKPKDANKKATYSPLLFRGVKGRMPRNKKVTQIFAASEWIATLDFDEMIRFII